MAKKKIIDVKSKVVFKKPVANCGKAATELARIRTNERAKIYRLEKKLASTSKKTEADRFRREIRAQRQAVKSISGDLNVVKNTCDIIDAAKSERKSLKLQIAAKNRKLAQMYESREFNPETHKKLNNEVFKLTKAVAAINGRIKGALYDVNKKLKFAPPEIAEKLLIDKDFLDKNYHDDFPEEYWDEYKEKEEKEEKESDETEKGEGDEEEEGQPDRLGYVEQMDEFFWQVAQDFDKNEASFLANYNRVTFEWGSSISNGDNRHFPGSQKSLILMTASDMWRWAAAHESYIRAIKLQNVLPDGESTKLKYICYWDKDGKPI